MRFSFPDSDFHSQSENESLSPGLKVGVDVDSVIIYSVEEWGLWNLKARKVSLIIENLLVTFSIPKRH